MAGTTDLSPHGLWPAFAGARKGGRTYPQFCSQDSGSSKQDHSRQGHEWDKHGTCTTLNKMAYFGEETAVHEADPIMDARELLLDHAGVKPVPTIALVEAVGGGKKIAIMADKSCRLTEITTCWSKNTDNTVGEQVDCPQHVLGSSRNSAVKKGCMQLFLDAAGGCSKISNEMIQIMKQQTAR